MRHAQWGEPETAAEADSQRRWQEGREREGFEREVPLGRRALPPKSAWWHTKAIVKGALGIGCAPLGLFLCAAGPPHGLPCSAELARARCPASSVSTAVSCISSGSSRHDSCRHAMRRTQRSRVEGKASTAHPEVLLDKCADALSIPKVGWPAACTFMHIEYKLALHVMHTLPDACR